MFIITVVILLRVLPGPHKPSDYLVIGTLATFICLLVVFLVVATAAGGPKNLFRKRRDNGAR